MATLTGVMLAAAALMAAATVPDVIELKHEQYAEHTKDIVEFPHQKHSAEFQAKFPAQFIDGCGTCHHDDDGAPLSDLQPGDDVNPCIECHSEPGEIPREVKQQLREKDLSLDQRRAREREYHAEALHDLCKGCHREVKRKNRASNAPTTCRKCHTPEE
jgi:hypothetical protein